MQSIKDILQNNPPKTAFGNHANQDWKQKPATTSSHSVITEENRKRIDRLFLRFAAIYGQAWRSQFKNDEYLDFAKREWQEGLAAYENNTLDLAIGLTRKRKKLPPTLPEFMDFCRDCAKEADFFKPEPQPSPNPEIAKVHLRQIKNLLNMKTNQEGEERC